MNPVQQYFQFAEVLPYIFFITSGFEDGYIRKVFLKISKDQFFLFRTYGQTDSVCMVFGQAVFCSLKVMTDMRRLKPKQFPVVDAGKRVQNFLLIRHEQKLVHPTTSKAFWEDITV